MSESTFSDGVGHASIAERPDQECRPRKSKLDGHRASDVQIRRAVERDAVHGGIDSQKMYDDVPSSPDSTATRDLDPLLRVPSTDQPATSSVRPFSVVPADLPLSELDGPGRCENQEDPAVESDADHSSRETPAGGVGIAPLSDLDGHCDREVHFTSAVESDAGHSSTETHTGDTGIATICNTIRIRWGDRQSWHREEKSLTLRAKARCRSLCDGDKTEADRIYKAALGKGEHERSTLALGMMLPLILARDLIEDHRKKTEKELVKLAKQLPVAPWVESVRGVGILSLVGIVGECGDLSNYANPGKLWKRLGLAPYHGRAAPSWRKHGGLSAEQWTEVGYSPARRSVMWNVGKTIIQARGPLKKIYDERKAYEAARPETESKMHAHNKAQRYVEKRFARMLWQAWRAADGHATSVDSNEILPFAK